MGQQEVQDPFLRELFRLLLNALEVLGLGHSDGQLGQIADDGLDVPPHVPHLGELGRLDLEEGRLCQLRQPPCDLGLADAGWTDHDDVLGHDLVTKVRTQLLPAPAIPQCDRHHPLGVPLADDVPIQLLHDLARR